MNPAVRQQSEPTMNTQSALFRPRRKILAFVALLATAGTATAFEPQEGIHYKTLRPAQPTSVAPGKVEVVEVFWYACGHCYVLEPKLEAWDRKGRPANAELVRLPATWNEMLQTHARLYYTMELLNRPQLNPEIWREINVKRNMLHTPEAIEAFFTSRGVSKADFQKAFAGFAVESKLMKAKDLNRRYRITSTPTVIVNGKYVTDASLAGGEEQLFQVINALVAKEAQPRR